MARKDFTVYKMKCYIVGQLETLNRMFPNYRGRDERELPDGWLYECDLSESEQKAAIEAGLQLFDHAGIIEKLAKKPKKKAAL